MKVELFLFVDLFYLYIIFIIFVGFVGLNLFYLCYNRIRM